MELALLLALSIAATRLEGVCVCPESREERGGRREGAATATFVNLTYSALTLRSPPTRCRAGQPTSTKEDQGSSKGEQRRDTQRVCEPPAILQRMGLQGEGRGAGCCVPWRTRTGSACTPPDSHPRTHTCITQPPPRCVKCVFDYNGCECVPCVPPRMCVRACCASSSPRQVSWPHGGILRVLGLGQPLNGTRGHMRGAVTSTGGRERNHQVKYQPWFITHNW